MATPAPEPPVPPAALEAHPSSGVGIATVGTALFALGLLVVLLRREELAAADRDWFLWTAIAGVVIGLLFRAFAVRRKQVYREHRLTLAEGAPPLDDR